MNNGDMNSIFEQINNLKKPVTEPTETKIDTSEDTLREVLNSVSEEIQRVLDENNLTQEDCAELQICLNLTSVKSKMVRLFLG